MGSRQEINLFFLPEIFGVCNCKQEALPFDLPELIMEIELPTAFDIWLEFIVPIAAKLTSGNY